MKDLKDIDNEIIKLEEDLAVAQLTYQNISESVTLAGIAIHVIPVLIKLILALLNKIIYLIGIPLITSLIAHTGNIRRVGSSVVSGNTSIPEVIQSINFDDVKQAAKSSGNPALFIRDVNHSLRNAAKDTTKEVSDKYVGGRDATGDTNLINDIIKSPLNIYGKSLEKFVSKNYFETNRYKLLETLHHQLSHLPDKIKAQTVKCYENEFDKARFSQFEDINERFDFKVLTEAIDMIIGFMYEYLEDTENKESKLSLSIHKDLHSKNKTFTEYVDIVAGRLINTDFVRLVNESLRKDSFKFDKGDTNKFLNNYVHMNFGYGDLTEAMIYEYIDETKINYLLEEYEYNSEHMFYNLLAPFQFYSKGTSDSDEVKRLNEYHESIGRKLEKIQDELAKDEEVNGVRNEQQLSYIHALLEFMKDDLSMITQGMVAARKIYTENTQYLFNVYDYIVNDIVISTSEAFRKSILEDPEAWGIKTKEMLQEIIADIPED